MTRSSLAAEVTMKRPLKRPLTRVLPHVLPRVLPLLLSALLAATGLIGASQALTAQEAAPTRPKSRPSAEDAASAAAVAAAIASVQQASEQQANEQRAAEQRAAAQKAADQKAAVAAQKAKTSAAAQQQIAKTMTASQGALDDGEGNLSEVITEMTEDGKFIPATGIGTALDAEALPPPVLVRPQPRNDKIIPPEAIEAAAALHGSHSAPSHDPSKGAVTNLPVPRYVTLKTNEGNARRGPGLTHRIDWVFTRAGMPLKLTGEYGHWRRIEDADGLGGWVHYALLSGTRGVIVTQERTKFYSRPDANSRPQFEAELNVVGKLLECDLDWCRISIEGNKGWAPIAALWGVDPGEIVE